MNHETPELLPYVSWRSGRTLVTTQNAGMQWISSYTAYFEIPLTEWIDYLPCV